MSLIQSLSIILGIISIGIILGKREVFSQTQSEGFETFLFKVAIPCSLFSATVKDDLSKLIDLPYVCSYLLTFLIVGLFTLIYFWRQNSASAICIRILASGYVNAAIYTLPVITFLLGDPKAAILSNLVQVVILQSVLVSILNILANREASIARRVMTSVSSPLILMPVLGLSLNFLQIRVPSLVISLVQTLGAGAPSFALFTFGLSLSKIKLHRRIFSKDLAFMVFAKNFLHPLVAALVGTYIFSLDRYWLSSLVIASSAPTAFVIYLISKKAAVDETLVKLTVAISSVLSLGSLLVIAYHFQA